MINLILGRGNPGGAAAGLVDHDQNQRHAPRELVRNRNQDRRRRRNQKKAAKFLCNKQTHTQRMK